MSTAAALGRMLVGEFRSRVLAEPRVALTMTSWFGGWRLLVWVLLGLIPIDDERPLTEHVHLAFPAADDATVRAFHAAALAAGYADHGAPGERAIYHPGYYGAFVLDPDGHNVEVVNHNR